MVSTHSPSYPTLRLADCCRPLADKQSNTPTASLEHPAYHYKLIPAQDEVARVVITDALADLLKPPNRFFLRRDMNLWLWGPSLPSIDHVAEVVYARAFQELTEGETVTDQSKVPKLD